MKDVLFLAWRYLLFHRWKTATLVGVVTVIVQLPLSLQLVLDRGSEGLRARAAATPLVLGAPGSPLELVLGALYFSGDALPPLAYATVDAIQQTGWATAIPLHVRYRVGEHRVVGTTPDYFGFRHLRVVAGRGFAVSGEAVLGAAAARGLRLAPGDTVMTSSETAFDLVGTYPTRLKVVGILEPAGTADDHALFVDLRTAWIVGGIGHGHMDLDDPEAASSVLRRSGDSITANASVVEYQEIEHASLADFHFHGKLSEFPLSAVVAVPDDSRSGTLLRGRYQDPGTPVRLVSPSEVMDDLLATVLTLRQYVVAGLVVLALGTLSTIALVFSLSIRLRRAEIATMTRIGATPARVSTIIAVEILLVLLAGVVAAGLLTLVVTTWDEEVFRWMLLSQYR